MREEQNQEKSLLSVKSLKAGYENFSLQELNLSVKKGQFMGIIGPNGSGKSTLFKTITSELDIVSGEINLNNRSIRSMSYKERAQNIAIVTQSIASESIRVEDYVLMGRIPYNRWFQFVYTKDEIALAHHFMKETNCFRFKDKEMTQLSGGEQQLAAIARALTQEPDILLLDEPTSHLDIHHQVEILNLLRKLNKELGLTLVMVIHDLNLAAEYCNELALFSSGIVHQQDVPELILTPENILKIYQTRVQILQNPISGKPSIFLISE